MANYYVSLFVEKSNRIYSFYKLDFPYKLLLKVPDFHQTLSVASNIKSLALEYVTTCDSVLMLIAFIHLYSLKLLLLLAPHEYL